MILIHFIAVPIVLLAAAVCITLLEGAPTGGVK